MAFMPLTGEDATVDGVGNRERVGKLHGENRPQAGYEPRPPAQG